MSGCDRPHRGHRRKTMVHPVVLSKPERRRDKKEAAKPLSDPENWSVHTTRFEQKIADSLPAPNAHGTRWLDPWHMFFLACYGNPFVEEYLNEIECLGGNRSHRWRHERSRCCPMSSLRFDFLKTYKDKEQTRPGTVLLHRKVYVFEPGFGSLP